MGLCLFPIVIIIILITIIITTIIVIIITIIITTIIIIIINMRMVLPTRGVPRRKIQRVVKAKLATVERKVMVQDRLTSPWNIAVWAGRGIEENLS